MTLHLSSRIKKLLGMGLLAAFSVSTQAATISWTGASGANILWSTPANWLPAVSPGSLDAAVFNDVGIVADNTTIDNSLTGNLTLQSLSFQNTSGFHNTLLSAGSTLTIANSGAGIVLGVGTETSPAAAQTESATISGSASLAVNASLGDIVVRQGSGASGSSKATLDLSQMNSFDATVAHVWVGVANPPGYVSANRNTGNLLLAKTNHIRATVSTAAAPGIDVGKSTSNNGGGSFLVLGTQNTIEADMMGFGRVKENGVSMHFSADAQASGQAMAKFRGANGVARVLNWTIGDGVTDSATTSVRATNDFTGGSLDAMVDTMVIARTSSGGTGAVVHKGILAIEHGLLDVNNLIVGLQSSTSVSSAKSADATVNVNGDAQVKVNTSLQLGAITVAGSPGDLATVATLNINGGTVTTPGITTFADTVSKVTVNGGKLSISGETSAGGTLDAPIDQLNLSDATIEMFGANAKLVAGTLTLGGSSNVIKITGLPVISVFPATIKVVQATTINGDFNVGLAPLPTGYVGTIVNSGSSIDLVLSSGPAAATLTWSGAASANWDLTSSNWLAGLNASLFAKGDAVLFNDSAVGSTTVNLVGVLQPGEITVNDSSKNYTFTGSGSLTGSASLTKTGSGSLTIANSGSNNFVGGVTITGGALIVGDGGVNGNLPVGPIVDNGSLVFNHSDNITITDAIAGAGSVTQNGSGTLTLNGVNAYAGGTIVNNGKVVINGTLPNTTGVTVGASASVSGSATVNAPVTVSGQLDPGSGTVAGTFSSGPLTLNAGAGLKFDLTTDTTAGANVNDEVVVNGNLAANNNSVTVNFTGNPTLGTPYTLLTYSGSASGSLNGSVKGTHYTAALDQSTAGQVTLTLSGAPASMKWNSTVSGTWDATAQNWLKVGGGIDAFFTGDAALFDDSVAGVQTAITIPAGVVIVPGSITVNSANNYSISGSGKISGTTGITKSGSGTLTINTTNDYTGDVTISGGTLKAGSQTALGATVGATTISAGATLDVNGQQLNGETITVSGSGQANAGAIVNSGAQQINAVGKVTLAGDVTFGGSGRWDLRGGGATLSANGNAVVITKVGTNQVSFVGATIDPSIGNIDIKGGVFAIQTTTVSASGGFGDPNATITVRGAGTLETWNFGAGVALDKKITVESGGTIWNENGISALSGSVSLAGNANLNVGGTSLEFDGAISGSGGITKTGTGQLILNANNSFTGQTTVNAGSLALTDNGSIGASAAINVGPGASINVSGRSDGTLTVASGQSIGGSGTVTGNLVVNSGATLSPGSGIGALTVTGDAALHGATTVQIDKPNHTNDTLKAASIAYDGTLNVTATGSLADGDTFKLFDAASYSGSFTAILPATPGPGQVWDATKLLVDGTLKVVGNAVKPSFSVAGAAVVSGNFTISGNGGIPNANYQILASSDIAASLNQWTVVANGVFDANGNFSASIPVNGNAQQYFALKIGAN